MYDIIGDIHGHATPLKALLGKLGYTERAGIWSHSERQAIFLGDFIDRGPQQVEVLGIVRSMVEAGHALAVMGNHEFNAVAWHTPDPQNPGDYLRPHTRKNHEQHQAFLEQIGAGSPAHTATIDWFRTLPLYLDLEGLRIVHACWHPPALAVLREYLDKQTRLLPSAWEALCRDGTNAYAAIETVLKGLEIALPEGRAFHDHNGHRREQIRTQWWNLEARTYHDLALVPASALPAIPHHPIPDGVLPGYDGAKPLFIGHYWLRSQPAPLHRHIACVDYSVAADEAPRKLCSYRWSGEREIATENFVWIEA